MARSGFPPRPRTASPIGVSGRVSPWSKVPHRYTRVPPSGPEAKPSRSPVDGSSNGYSVVMGRDWVSQIRPAASMTHSASCGVPNRC